MPQESNSFTENREFKKLFDQHIGTVFARQLLLAEHLEVKEEPAINLEAGIVEFSNGQKYSIALLGAQLEDDTFLWAWAEENAGIFKESNFKAPFAPALLKSALAMKAAGEEENIPALSQPKVVLELSAVPLVPDEFNGDHLACLSAGLNNKAYWRDTRDEGVFYYLLTETPEQLLQPYSAPHILNTVEQIASYFETNNRPMLESFLVQQGFSVTWEEIAAYEGQGDEDDIEAGSRLTAKRDKEEITAIFDEDNYLTEIEAHGFEGEEYYQNHEEDGDFDMDDMLGQWGHDDTIPTIIYDEDGEFPPKI